jgi:hypothetical protein
MKVPNRPVTVAVAAAVAAGASMAAAAAPDSCIPETASPRFCGDDGPAIAAKVALPYSVAMTSRGGILIADAGNQRIRRISRSGTITTAAGTGTAGFSGDGGPATKAQLAFPVGVAPTQANGVLIADNGNHRIRRVSRSGKIITVAGTGTPGFSGDGGPATQAQIAFPAGVAVIPKGGFLIADNGNHRVRQVSRSGKITTVAGTGTVGSSGDGGPATGAQLDSPTGVAPLSGGAFLIADSRGNRVRRVSRSGKITTVAGTGTAGFSGDGGPATEAQLDSPTAAAASPRGGFLIADRHNLRIRRVSRSGKITTVAGTGTDGFSGDGGPATQAELGSPIGVAALPRGGFLIADNGNDRIRRVSVGGDITTLTGGVPSPTLARFQLSGAAFPSQRSWNFYISPKPAHATAGRQSKILYVTNRAASVRARVRKRSRGRLVFSSRAKAVRAGGTYRFRLRRFHAGHYTVRLSGRVGRSGRTDLSKLIVRHR